MENIFPLRKPYLTACLGNTISSAIQEGARQNPAVTKTAYSIEVGKRLRAIASEFGCDNAVKLAAFVGASRPAVNTWLTGKALPPVPYMIKLCDPWGMTLDFIYRGDPDGIRRKPYLRIIADMAGEKVPRDVEDEAPLVAEEASPPKASRHSRRGATAAASGNRDES